MAKPFYVEYKGEVWNANFCPCPPSVSAEIIVMMTRGEINRGQAKKLYKIMHENWTKVLNKAINES